MPVMRDPSGGMQFKLGKTPAKRDARNLQLKAILRRTVTLPAEYDLDAKHTGVPTPVYGNNQWGCCVIAGRAHQTLRWGAKQQMSWAFFKAYCDEAYAIIDALNTQAKRSNIDERKLDAFLETVSKPSLPGATNGAAAPPVATEPAPRKPAAKKRPSRVVGDTVRTRAVRGAVGGT